MKKSLVYKLFICYAIVAASMFTLLNTYGFNQLKQSLIKNKKTVLYKEATLISSEYMNNYYNDFITLPHLYTQLKTIDTFLDVRIWIVNSIGDIILDTRDQSIEIKHVNLYDLAPNILDNQYVENFELPNYITEPMLSVMRPVTMEYSVKGFIIIHSSMDSIQKESLEYIDFINICFLIFLIFMLLTFLYIYYLTVRPLKKIITAARNYSSGDFDYPLEIKTNDEYKDLSDAIKYMAGELNNLEDYQKKFVANISHDFRSPLTSIKGYAEAILDGTIPVEMQDKYLNIILFETERLTKLTTMLLELNNFKKNGAMLNITTFDINHVITKTAESFEGICTQKKITLNLVFSEEKTYVNADVTKIQQVLYNLIDNAIKFSPSSTKIKVTTEEKNEKVFISIKDHGIGIPKESIKKIWDRFYKTDTSRGKDKIGTGLGLSITKDIMIAHEENINVISTEGVGTEFTFTLPVGEL